MYSQSHLHHFEKLDMKLRLLILSVATLIVSSCSPRQQEILKIVQFCVKNDADIQLLSREMRATATREGMTFIDSSKAAREALVATTQTPAQKGDTLGVISFYMGNNAGTGVSAGNIDASPYDIALGFAYDSDAKAANAFANRLIARLAKHWRIIPVAPADAPLALKECSDQTTLPQP